ncbi:LysR substrate-binding domain-containing protein [Pseudoalteromonas denitrificans]|uniref:DNA-binding transcriptional regulator, LysR family n=1 Tax=Pseudoalteromonas denitrificans DSM 6059 TaxID=1123010 RepID=A0A1I1N1Y6_9GAMM|nr:LysR substrate-binding domain-containing protein [Pseudoalteromonas denitrificans]SFC91647.1 DNA-binding transcriptional regulator, LysR family [Pseudoalteromonas denitrificans DSM 6059]
MYKYLPPLKPLRAFEATARHMSFSLAAKELCVTQSAVSHQVKNLESFLGMSLFIRQGKHLSLSEKGGQYFSFIQRMFISLDNTTAKIMGSASGVTRMAVYGSFAMKWLIPRLPEFRKKYPEIDLRISMLSEEEIDLDLLGVDCGICLGKENTQYQYHHLLTEEWFPVCSPQIYDEIKNNPLAESLMKYPLLEGDHQNDWQKLFDNLGLTFDKPPVYHYFSHVILLLQAAIEGQGIALSSDILSKDDIDSGRLVRLPLNSDQNIGIISHYYFCFTKDRMKDLDIKTVQNWLLSFFK